MFTASPTTPMRCTPLADDNSPNCRFARMHAYAYVSDQRQAMLGGASGGSNVSLTDEALAALVGAMAAAGTRFGASEPPAPQANPVWRRVTYEQSIRPRWR